MANKNAAIDMYMLNVYFYMAYYNKQHNHLIAIYSIYTDTVKAVQYKIPVFNSMV